MRPLQVTEISMSEFLVHSSVVWLNPQPSLGRIRKDPEMTVFGELLAVNSAPVVSFAPPLLTRRRVSASVSFLFLFLVTTVVQHSFRVG